MRLTSWLLDVAEAVRRTTLPPEELHTAHLREQAEPYIAQAEELIAEFEHGAPIGPNDAQRIIRHLADLNLVRERDPDDERIEPLKDALREIALRDLR